MMLWIEIGVGILALYLVIKAFRFWLKYRKYNEMIKASYQAPDRAREEVRSHDAN